MDTQHLVAVLAACSSPDQAMREAAERALNQHKHQAGQLSNLLRASLESSLDPAIQQAAAISFKNLVRKDWGGGDEAEGGKPSPLPAADMEAVRGSLLDALSVAPTLVASQLKEAAATVVRADFPRRLPGLAPGILTALGQAAAEVEARAAAAAGEAEPLIPARVEAALTLLRLATRKYEFSGIDDESDDEGEEGEAGAASRAARAQRAAVRPPPPMDELVGHSFPALLAFAAALLRAVSGDASARLARDPSPFRALALIGKCFWSATYMRVPAPLAADEAVDGWISWVRGVALLPAPKWAGGAGGAGAGAPDADELEALAFWKGKKWAFHVANRLLRRYGDARSVRRAPDVAFARRLGGHKVGLVETALAQLASATGGTYVSKRVLHDALELAATAMTYSDTWKALKPHALGLLTNVAFPLLCFDDDDAELWESDPNEYIRKGYDVVEEVETPRTAAGTLVEQAARVRGKALLDGFLAHLVGVMGEYGRAGGAGDPAGSAARRVAARRMDGACLAIGSLSSVLQAKSKYRGQLEPMLLQHVAPLFEAPEGHLRAKACWLAGTYAGIDFHDGKGRGATFQGLMAAVAGRLRDPDLPVRMDAAVAVRSFIEEIDEDAVDEFRPIVPALLEAFLELGALVDSDELMFSLENLVERFSKDMAPYALDVTRHLVAQLDRIQGVGEDGGLSAGGGGSGKAGGATGAGPAGSDDASSDGDGGMVAYGILRTLCVVLDAVAELPELFPQLEDVLWPVLDRTLQSEAAEVIEEVLAIVGALTYHAKGEPSARLWSLVPRMLVVVRDWAVDYFEDVLSPLDNLISRGAGYFFSHPDLVRDVAVTVEHAMRAGPETFSDAVACAPALMVVVLVAARGGDLAALAPGPGPVARDLEARAAAQGLPAGAAAAALPTSASRGGLADALVPGYVQLCLEKLQAGIDDDDLTDAVLSSLLACFYYDAPLAAQTAGPQRLAAVLSALDARVAERKKERGAGAGRSEASRQAALAAATGAARAQLEAQEARRGAGRMRHFSDHRAKKMLALGLASLLGSPGAPLSPEAADCALRAAVRLLLALKDQEAERETARIAREAFRKGVVEGSSGDSLAGAGPAAGASASAGPEDDGDLEDSEDDSDADERNYLNRLLERRAGGATWDTDSDDDDDDLFDDDEDDATTLVDDLDPYVFLADSLGGLRAADQAAFARLAGAAEAGTRAAVESMMVYAQERKS